MITCSRGHEYPTRAKWCPQCGELNFTQRLEALPDSSGPFLMHGVKKSLRIRFKRACEENETNMKAVLLDYMELYASTNGWGPEKAPKNGPDAYRAQIKAQLARDKREKHDAEVAATESESHVPEDVRRLMP